MNGGIENLQLTLIFLLYSRKICTFAAKLKRSMKDYKNILECLKRRKEFDKYYSTCYNEEHVAKLFGIEDINDWLEFREEIPLIESVMKLGLLYSYVYVYFCIESMIISNPEDEDLSELNSSIMPIQIYSALTSSEIYDLLKKLHPAYAEALLSFINCTRIDAIEKIIESFNECNKQEFLELLGNESCNKRRLETICRYINTIDITTQLSHICRTIDFIEENDISLKHMPLDEINGGAIIHEIFDNKSFCDNVIESNETLDLTQLPDSTKQYLFLFYEEAHDIYREVEQWLTENQKEQYMTLLLANGLLEWNDILRNNFEKKIQECENNIQNEFDEIFLPEDFFADGKYIDTFVPCRISGFKTSDLKEKGVKNFIEYIKELSNLGFINRDIHSQYKFIRAFTGRVPDAMRGTPFEKATWKGNLGDLLYTIQKFTYQEREKYMCIPKLFELNETLLTRYEQAMKKNPSSYAKASKDYVMVIDKLYDFKKIYTR